MFHVDYWPSDDPDSCMPIKHIVETLANVQSVSDCECDVSTIHDAEVCQLVIKLEKTFYYGLCLWCVKNDCSISYECDEHHLGSFFELCKRIEAPMWIEDHNHRLQLENRYYFMDPEDSRQPFR